MPIYPHATRRLLPSGLNHYSGGLKPRLIVMHIMEGSLAGTDGWFHNPVSQVSAHFGIGVGGEIIQWVDTKDAAWHAVEANAYAIGIELEGNSGEPATDAQLQQAGRLYAWAHSLYPEIDFWLNVRPFTGHGLSWHGLGGVRWGNHPQCPGTPIIHQLPEILAVAEDVYNAMQSHPLVDAPKAEVIEEVNPTISSVESSSETESKIPDGSNTSTDSTSEPMPARNPESDPLRFFGAHRG